MSTNEKIIPFDTDEDKEIKNNNILLKKQNKIYKILMYVFLALFLMTIIYFVYCKTSNKKKNTGKGILILKESDIAPIVEMRDIIEADRQALSIYSKGKANIPLRSNLNVPEYNGQCLFMNGYVASAKALGVKIVSVYPKNIDKKLTSVPATIVLVDVETGFVNSIIDGTYLTKMRTGAVSGLATELLARKDSKVFALIGTGGQAVTQLEAVLTVRKIELVKVYDLYFERAEAFAKQMQEKFGSKFNVKIYATKTTDEAVEDADIITTVTVSKKPVINAEKVKKNAHINGVGSYTPETEEIPPEILMKASKIYVDTKDAIKESGDIVQPLKNGQIKDSKITGELGQLINGEIKGRENDEEMTFFETTGNAVLDVVAAQKIYEIAKNKNIGNLIDF